MKFKYLISILLVAVFIISCDKYSDYQMLIDNRTTDTIKIHLSGTSADVNGTTLITALPDSCNLYYDATGIKIKTKNFICDPQISEDEVTITTSSGRSLIKDISNKENWYCETDQNNNLWMTIFKIEETDLE